MRAERFQRIGIVEAAPRANWRPPRHQDLATGTKQLFRRDKILRRIGKNLKSSPAEYQSSLDQTKDVGLQTVFFADDFELDPRRVKNLARHLCGRHRLLDRPASGG